MLGSNGTGIQNGGNGGSGVIGYGVIRSNSVNPISKAFSVFGKIYLYQILYLI